jgi:NodT family efflux transporter outer membrane factor (OMF) lipoprotein
MAAVLSCACMVGPKYKKPAAPVPAKFKEPPPAGWKQAQPSDEKIRGKWWELYHDVGLSALEEQVAINNQNVLAAEANYRVAKASVRVARAALFPTVTANPTITVSGSGSRTGGRTGTLTGTGTTVTGVASTGSGVITDYVLPIDASWQADVWGAIRRNVTANIDLAQAADAQLENVRLLYQSELAVDYFQMHGLDTERELLEQTVKSYGEFLDLTRRRFEGGIATDADVAQAQAQWYNAQSQLTDLGVLRAQLEHAIAVLIGKPPANLRLPSAILKAPPPPVPVALPSTLLERRPDIADAERRVAAANEQIGIAQAAYYPALTLGGTVGVQSTSFLNWLTWPSRFWSAGPQLAQTLFDAGRRRGQVQTAEAQYDATAANYRQTVLTAFQQVEDNLAELRILEVEATELARATAAAERSLEVSTAQYKAGTAPYLQVLTAQTVVLGNQRSEISVLERRLAASVGLVQALGGGWDTSKLPSPSEIRSNK